MGITATELEALNAPGPSQIEWAALDIRDYLSGLTDDELYNESFVAYERGLVCQEKMRKNISHRERAYLLSDMEAAIEMRAETVIELMRRNLPVI